MDIKQKLYWLIQAGISSFCGEKPLTDIDATATQDDTPATVRAQVQAHQAKTLTDLNADKEAFNLSSLKKTATHTVLGIGAIHPTLMCVMEAPDTEADRSGQALTGISAEQLKKMMAAIHLDIDRDVYLTYLSPWRTPGNRPLTEQERALFLPFLVREIELVQPQKILLFGAGPAYALLKAESLAKARGQWHDWAGTPVRVTLALSSLKTTPLRQQAWDDLQSVEKH